MKIPTICRYCGGKIIKSTTRALYPKGSEPIYLCVNCNAYVGCYPDGSPMGKVANTVLRLKRQETHRIFDRFWREQGWTRSAAYRWLAQNLHLKEHETHIGMMEMDECEQVIRLCRKYGKHKKEAAYAPIAQAKAWLSGRDTVEPSDLTTLCAYLWTAPEERTIIQSTLERMCNDPLKDRLDTILAEAVEGYQEFTDTADAPAARRIGKLRDEFMSLYITLSQMLSNAQSDAEREKINACLEELERYSKEAHASVQYSYVPLRELYDLKAS